MVQIILLILNIFLIECILSIDNIAVLSTLVLKLPKREQSKALKYGVFGAFFFRGALLFIASWLVKLIWLKGIAGIYLIYLSISHFTKKVDSVEELKKPLFASFWGVVLSVELVDLVFSSDNIFAAIAMSSNIYVILSGVLLGIIAMRFVAVLFVKLIQQYPLLENSAFIVIWILGVRLLLGAVCHYIHDNVIENYLSSNLFTLIMSGVNISIFLVPIIQGEYYRKKYL